MKIRKTIVIILIAAVLIILLALRVMQINNKMGGAINGLGVQATEVKKEDLQTHIVSTGKVKAVDEKTVYAEAANRIVLVHKAIGDSVRKGELIITLDKEAAEEASNQLKILEFELVNTEEALKNLLLGGSEQEILSAQSELIRTKNTAKETNEKIKVSEEQLRIYEANIKRQKLYNNVQEQLFNEGIISKAEMEEAEIQLLTFQQQKDELESSILAHRGTLENIEQDKKVAEYKLSVLKNKVQDPSRRQIIKTKENEISALKLKILNKKKDIKKAAKEVIAPMDGIITELCDKEGLFVEQGTPLVTIIDDSKLIIECEISSYYAADLQVGLPVKVKYEGSEILETEGKVIKITPFAVQTDAQNKINDIRVKIEIIQPEKIIKSGFSVTVNIIAADKKGIYVVPSRAVINDEDENMDYLYVIKKNGTLEKRIVTRGLESNTKMEVSGVVEGEMVVVKPNDKIREGIKVSYTKNK